LPAGGGGGTLRTHGRDEQGARAMIEWLSDPSVWASLATLTLLEVVLGIDNLIFISVATNALPEARRPLARKLGLFGALAMRIVFLSSVVWLTGLTEPIFELMRFAVSWRDLILIAGGLFLLVKGTQEIHNEMEGERDAQGYRPRSGFLAVVTQIMLLDLVFSIDSVITAVGMTRDLTVMVIAIVIAMGVMLFAAGPVGNFIERHPTVKMLALSFLLLIGVALVADGLHFHIPRSYLYFAIAFSIMVEFLNLLRSKRKG
jgi:predicted tellurium resistance membrane protein TerC